MRPAGAESFFYDVIHSERIRGMCLDIASLPESERGPAIRALGYDFSPKELDSAVCRAYYKMRPEARAILGPGALRDIVMKKWGKPM